VLGTNYHRVAAKKVDRMPADTATHRSPATCAGQRCAARLRGIAVLTTAALLASACVAKDAPPSATPISALSRDERPELASVKPPREPKRNHFHISEKKLAELPLPRQPQALTDALMGLEQGSIAERKAKLAKKAVADLVYVRGGSFMRGDFASLMGVPGVTRMTYNEDDKVVKEITLSDFWIAKYKTTYAEFDVFTDEMGKERNGFAYGKPLRHALIPAGTYWQQAKDYCLWLGRLTGLPFDLPTEAQWEYAARSRGQFFMIGTDDGNIEYGRNLPYGAQQRLYAAQFGGRLTSYPVGTFPPNPLGLFDVSQNGTEWVQDWYAPDAYEKAEARDPKGPSSGEKKVRRGWGADDMAIGVNAWRRSEFPVPLDDGPNGAKRELVPPPYLPSVRCAAGVARGTRD
jgi:formylglycine-generating enzyme